MSSTLTTSRVIIDLTGDTPSPPPSGASTPALSVPRAGLVKEVASRSHDGAFSWDLPPAKRRRVEDDFNPPKRNLSESIKVHVLRHVNQAVQARLSQIESPNEFGIHVSRNHALSLHRRRRR